MTWKQAGVSGAGRSVFWIAMNFPFSLPSMFQQQTIQSAIDSASPGDTITVAKGTYAEQILITKNGIKLVGQNGATIVPPPTAVTNGCSGLAGPLPPPATSGDTQAGICILGAGVVLGDWPGSEHRKIASYGAPVEDVQVKGFTIRGFSGLNVAVVNAKNAEVRENTLTDGGAYGSLTVGSVGTVVTRNTVNSSALSFIGICMDDRSDVRVSANTISEMVIGLCVQTDGADVRGNTVRNCCVGAFVDPGIRGASLTHNQIGPTNPFCTFGFVSGIRIAGAVSTNAQHNTITGQTDFNFPDGHGPSQSFGAGIAVYDFDAKGAKATGNVVDFNKLSGNDIDIDTAFTGTNEIKHNTCTTPSTLCSKQ
ncbi:hypothetical protein GGTG_07456 [Gaeumannomyces tritici R3-111a-1]|uniref:Right handed beta helix domain-containing protein n=1 Tax=Gaeumannomyces tritici (strain R3-111a-1) TaxID=644352 RepID=J3P1Q8_GAET3|nr:hypothetical protein GGTG_07456 [Gaeumannomyces tritici R3-111a-1]EJT73600.1 hypothetical protein GGTG_07456 [Gaeumannomyces tritici R3-111a-1]